MTPEERQTLIEQYAAGYMEVQKSLEGFPEEQLTAHPIAGKWSACEIVQHLADSEMTSAIRLRRILAEEKPAIQSYDQDYFAQRLKYNERDMQPALDVLRGVHTSTAQLLRMMNEDDWKREGTHPEHKSYTAEDWLRIYSGHARNHAAQIRSLREALK